MGIVDKRKTVWTAEEHLGVMFADRPIFQSGVVKVTYAQCRGFEAPPVIAVEMKEFDITVLCTDAARDDIMRDLDSGIAPKTVYYNIAYREIIRHLETRPEELHRMVHDAWNRGREHGYREAQYAMRDVLGLED